MPVWLAVLLLLLCFAYVAWTAFVAIGARQDRRRISRVRRDLAPVATGERFHPGMLEGLPEPVCRYFKHAIAEGTELHDGAILAIDGEMLIKPGGPWLPFKSTEMIRSGHGMVWEARIQVGAVSVSGYDMCHAGEGRMIWRMLGLYPLAAAEGPAVSESAAGRMAAELVWLPGMLLPQFGARWSAESENELRCRLAIDSHSFELRLWIDGDGRLEKLRMQRLRNLDDGSAEHQPFGMESSADFSAAGLRIPGDCKVAWLPDDPERFEFWHGVVRGVVQGDP